MPGVFSSAFFVGTWLWHFGRRPLCYGRALWPPSPHPEPSTMPAVSRLLVAVSSPWASEKLAQPIADLAERLRCEVVVIHVARLQETDEEESAVSERGEQT